MVYGHLGEIVKPAFFYLHFLPEKSLLNMDRKALFASKKEINSAGKPSVFREFKHYGNNIWNNNQMF